MPKQRGSTAYYCRRNYLRLWLFVALCGAASAFGECEQAGGRLQSSEGAVSIEQAGNWQPLTIGACIPVGVRVQVSGGRAVFILANETLLRASGNTLLRFSAPENKNWIHLFDGVLHFITRTPRAFDVQTDYVNAGVKGTEFILSANHAEQYGQVVMIEGEVLASNELGQQSVKGGAAVIARKGQAPQLLTVPAIRDAVQWTLYYPPVPAAGASRFQPIIERLYRSDAAGAVAQLEALPVADRDADYFALAAAIDLHRGEVARARAALDQALALQPDHPSALALSATRALVIGDAEGASALLGRAQAKSPNDAAVLTVRSYLEQARFQLSAALDSAREAGKRNPDDALIQARIAELALMNSDTRQAASAANNSIRLQPNFARAHAIDGFVRLQQLRFDDAETAFKRATELDPTDPLPRLGLGLINIRHNRVSEGREQLAIAVALDPGQSLLRSYLGKAYQEGGRERLANDQYILAKIFDDADPTPWFYSALLARAQNRPFDALDDLNESIVRNDNRAVYRSRLQLDADEAARTASQAEIYRELGFEELTQSTAARAVSAAPGEYGGHRQLAEAYADNPQYDAARSSEVLQAQLLQPLSATPILPLLGETNLLAIDGAGPSALGFREYNAMFVRERPRLSVSGLGGSNGTGADEITLSGVYDRFAYALNQYHYETQGYRDNNDAKYDVISAYGKFQANEDVSFFLSANRRDEDLGDVEERLLIDQSQPRVGEREKIQSTTLGGDFQVLPNTTLLAALNYQKVEVDEFSDTSGTGFDSDSDSDQDTSNAELQAMINNSIGHVVVGADWADSDVYSTVFISTSNPLLQDFVPSIPPVDGVDHYRSGYGYWTLTSVAPLELTFGVVYTELEKEVFSRTISGWYPKFSAVYKWDSGVDLRAAYFKSLKRPLAMEQTLEPTQVGGFNQFVDEDDGVESDNYAAGIDIDAADGHFFGGEIRKRKLDLFLASDEENVLKAKQLQSQLFWNWSAQPWAVSLSYQYEKSENTSFLLLDIPVELTIQRVPLQVKWLSGSGLSVGAVATYFEQSAKFIQEDDNGLIVTTESSETFTLFDVLTTYQFWKNRAEVELRCANIFDDSFTYQNSGLYDQTPRISPYTPERTFRVGLKLAY